MDTIGLVSQEMQSYTERWPGGETNNCGAELGLMGLTENSIMFLIFERLSFAVCVLCFVLIHSSEKSLFLLLVVSLDG